MLFIFLYWGITFCTCTGGRLPSGCLFFVGRGRMEHILAKSELAHTISTSHTYQNRIFTPVRTEGTPAHHEHLTTIPGRDSHTYGYFTNPHTHVGFRSGYTGLGVSGLGVLGLRVLSLGVFSRSGSG